MLLYPTNLYISTFRAVFIILFYFVIDDVKLKKQIGKSLLFII